MHSIADVSNSELPRQATDEESHAKPPRRPRGFALMSPERRREIASMGGKSVPDEKRTFSRRRKLAVAAGRKGGMNVPAEKRTFSRSREIASLAGRKGGQSCPDEKRAFSQDRVLAAEAGRKGRLAAHSTDGPD